MARPAAPTRRRRGDMHLMEIAAELKLVDLSMRSIIEQVRRLVALSGFPEPRSPRFRVGKRLRGAAAVHARAVWDRDAVEHWLEGDLPPPVAAARAGLARDAARAQLTANLKAVCS